MAADNPSTWPVKNGIGGPVSAPITVDPAGNTTPQLAIRTNGAPVEESNPLPSYLAVAPSLAAGTAKIGSLQPATYSNAITIAPAVSTTSEALITAGGPATGRLEIFNNTTGSSPGTLWINPAGGTAVAGQGIPVLPGGSYTWVNGLATIPTGISDSGALSISGAGGY
jgi:hypothetical protein